MKRLSISVHFYSFLLYTVVILLLSNACFRDRHPDSTDPPGVFGAFKVVETFESVRSFAGRKAELSSFRASFVEPDGTIHFDDSYKRYGSSIYPNLTYIFFRPYQAKESALPSDTNKTKSTGGGKIGAGTKYVTVNEPPPSAPKGYPYQEVTVSIGRSHAFYMGKRARRQYDIRNMFRSVKKAHRYGLSIPPPQFTFKQLWLRAIKEGAPKNAVAFIKYDFDGYQFIISQPVIQKSQYKTKRTTETIFAMTLDMDGNLVSKTINGKESNYKEQVYPVQLGTVTDARDKKIYKTVAIGRHIWLAENMNFKSQESWCYQNKEKYCAQFGRLYTWDAALKSCPAQWHLATDNEWQQLERFLGMGFKDLKDYTRRIERHNVGGKLIARKSWSRKVMDMTNESGFSALAAGYREDSKFAGRGSRAMFWTSTLGPQGPFIHSLYRYHYKLVNRGDLKDRKRGLSVRCIRDKLRFANAPKP